MANQQITYDDKVGVIPKTVRINQVWDDDMNEIKTVINANDLKALYNGTTTLPENLIIQVTPTASVNINDGLLSGIIVSENNVRLDGFIKVLPDGVTPVVGELLAYSSIDGSITSIDPSSISGGLIDGINIVNANPFRLSRNLSAEANFFTVTGADPYVESDLKVTLGVPGLTPDITLDQNTRKIILTNDGGNGVKLELDDDNYIVKILAEYLDLGGSSLSILEAAPVTAAASKEWVLSKLGNDSELITDAATVSPIEVDGKTYVLENFSQDTTINLNASPLPNKTIVTTFLLTGTNELAFTFSGSAGSIYDYGSGAFVSSIDVAEGEQYKVEVRTVNLGGTIRRYISNLLI